MKLFMQFSAASCYYLTHRPKYLPQHHIFKHPPSMLSSLNVRDQVLHTHTHTHTYIYIYIVCIYVCVCIYIYLKQ